MISVHSSLSLTLSLFVSLPLFHPPSISFSLSVRMQMGKAQFVFLTFFKEVKLTNK